MVHFGIIGTAGRGDDSKFLDANCYARMVDAAMKVAREVAIDFSTVTVVSGGAAYADHVAVTLATRGIIRPDQLEIYLPAELAYFGYDEGDEPDKWSKRVADTANYYHKMFSAKVGIDSIAELNAVRKQGAVMEHVKGGFHARNSRVAKSVRGGVLLAFTSGSPNSDQKIWTARQYPDDALAVNCHLKDGGTADTWNKAKCQKIHARIGKSDLGISL